MAPEPGALIGQQAADLTDWRGPLFLRLRALIGAAQPDLNEDWKWDTAVWVLKGNVCALGVFRDHLKVNFFKGASLADPQGLFNAGLEAKASRAIDFLEGAVIDEAALQDLVRAAAALNTAKR